MATTVKISDGGVEMPAIGFGTFKLDASVAKEIVEYAIEVGYRHLDCAWLYGNEEEIGEAIARCIKRGIVKREDLFITTKLWRTYHDPAQVKPALMKSLKKLGLNHVDLYLIHFPVPFKNGEDMIPTTKKGDQIFDEVTDYMDTWKAMEELAKEGLVKNIGLSNFNEYQIERILKHCSIRPCNNQVESHPYFNNEKLLRFCTDKGLSFTAYGALGHRSIRNSDGILLGDPALIKIAESLRKTVAQIVLRYQIQRGASVLVKSANRERIKQNFQVFDFELSEAQMNIIKNLDKSKRLVVMEQSQSHKFYPFRENYSED